MSRKRLRAFVPALAAGVVLGVMALTQNLPDTAQTIALGALAASAIVAAVVQRDDLRTHLTVILAIASVTASGFVRIGPIYLGLAVAFALAVTIALRPPDADAPPARGPRATRARLVLAIVGATVAVTLLFSLPPLHKRAESRITRWLSGGIGDSSNLGFASRMRVGSMHHMLFDDRVVFRVYGKRPQYLRGAVLDRYERGEWWSSLDFPRTTIPATTPLEETTTRIDVARDAPLSWGVEARWFTADDACEVHTTSGIVSVDLAGIYHPEPPELRDVIAYTTCATPRTAAAPHAEDTALPPRMQPTLTQIATPWTAGAKTDREKLAAIQHELARFEYSLH
ncbi:MAG TPA: transglutaminaseTgpA domain-containing protein, partial [Labilithrix sp.]